jgi:hypothetical protein
MPKTRLRIATKNFLRLRTFLLGYTQYLVLNCPRLCYMMGYGAGYPREITS